MKINTSNGILIDGVMYHSAGFGSVNLETGGKHILGEGCFYSKGNNGMRNGWGGNVHYREYYLTTVKAVEWNLYLELLDIREKAKELTPEGAEYLGYFTFTENESYEDEEYLKYSYAYLDKRDVINKLNNPLNFIWLTLDELDDCIKNEEIYLYRQPKEVEKDALMERAIELAVGGVELLGYGRPEGYEVKEGYEYDFIESLKGELWLCLPCEVTLNDSSCIFFQRKIKEETPEETCARVSKDILDEHSILMGEELIKHLKGDISKPDKREARRYFNLWVEALKGKEVNSDLFNDVYSTLCQFVHLLIKKGGKSE